MTCLMFFIDWDDDGVDTPPYLALTTRRSKGFSI